MQEQRQTAPQTDSANRIDLEKDAIPQIVSVQISDKHAFSKTSKDAIKLIENVGVEGDAHAGATDQHLYHIKRFGLQPNLRQVHLIQTERKANKPECPGDRSSPCSTVRHAASS